MIHHPSTPTAALAELLELSASVRPQLLELQVEALFTSHLRLVLQDLAIAFAVPQEKLGRVIAKACLDLDTLETRQAHWRDPAKILESPNVAALIHLCRARALRAREDLRRRKLETILRKLQRAHEHARTRSWIESLLGPPLPASNKPEGP